MLRPLAVAVLLASPAGAPAQTPSKRFELADLVHLVRLDDPQISPDGKAVVFVVSRASNQTATPTTFDALRYYTRAGDFEVNRDGYLFQSPVSWYTQRGVWDLTPGFDVVEHFDRPARPDCLFCHSDRAESVPHRARGRCRRADDPTRVQPGLLSGPASARRRRRPSV